MSHLSDNIVPFPSRTPLPASLKQAAARTRFAIGDHVHTQNSINNKPISGFIRQIQIDPLSGAAWRALIATDCGCIWRNVQEISHAR